MPKTSQRSDLGRFSCRCFFLAVLCVSIVGCGMGALPELERLRGDGKTVPLLLSATIFCEWLLGITAFVASLVGLLTGFDGLIGRGLSDKGQGTCAMGLFLNGSLLVGSPILVVLFGD